jgi:hypothetical protein
MTRCVSCVKFYRPFVDFDIGERAGSGVQLKESKRMKTRASVDSEDLLVQNLYTPLILSGRSWLTRDNYQWSMLLPQSALGLKPRGCI